MKYEDQYFHMAEFLSLQQGKIYHPGMSRLSHWIESARNDFYENVEKTIHPLHVASGVYQNDIVAFIWIPSEGLRVGYVIRFVTSPSLRSSYPLFELKAAERKNSKKITLCVKMLNFHKISPAEWMLTQPASPDFEWCRVRCILQVLGTVTDKSQWPATGNSTNVE